MARHTTAASALSLAAFLALEAASGSVVWQYAAVLAMLALGASAVVYCFGGHETGFARRV